MLQAVYEFQTIACQVTGSDIGNAWLYDGATALVGSGLFWRLVLGDTVTL